MISVAKLSSEVPSEPPLSTTICAVVLTYRRKDLLQECLTAIRAQSYQCDRIVVIDNHSDDGTLEMLRDKWKSVEVYSLTENIGAAGGFHVGMQVGYRGGHDFLWVMDDDVIPRGDALERLVAANRKLANSKFSAPFVISTAWSPEGELTNVPRLDRSLNALGYENWAVLLEHRLVPVKRATFVSILLPRDTLSHYGLPIASMFIWGDDSEFTTRVTRDNPGYLVGDSRVVHARQRAGIPDIWTEEDINRIGYHYHHERNQMYLRRLSGLSVTVRHLCRQIWLGVLLAASGRFFKAKVVLFGVTAGLVFDPHIAAPDALSRFKVVQVQDSNSD